MGATNTPGSTARDLNMQLVHYLRKRIVWDGPTAEAIKVGTLPAGALIVPNASGAFVSTAFAGGTPQTLNIGHAAYGSTAADADEYATALVLTSAGQIELDVEANLLVPDDLDVTATLTAGTSPTAGVLDVVIAYIPDNDG